MRGADEGARRRLGGAVISAASVGADDNVIEEPSAVELGKGPLAEAGEVLEVVNDAALAAGGDPSSSPPRDSSPLTISSSRCSLSWASWRGAVGDEPDDELAMAMGA